MAAQRVRTMLDGNQDYEDYRALPTLPRGVGSWELDEDGDPIVHTGEVMCREDLGGGHLCGRRFSKRNNMINHGERIHGWVQASPSAHGIGIPPGAHIVAELRWYAGIMQTHRVLVAPLAAVQANIAAAQALVPQPPPWNVVWLPTGDLDCLRMSAAVRTQGRQVGCDTCIAEEDRDPLQFCTFFRQSDFWRCENRDLWVELIAEDAEESEGEQEQVEEDDIEFDYQDPNIPDDQSSVLSDPPEIILSPSPLL